MPAEHILRKGTVLIGTYRIESVLGSGGFGITYLAEDLRLQSRVALKEYFPIQLAVRMGDQTVAARPDGNNGGLYTWGRDKFKQEADTLARLRHANIVGVKHMFEANNTSYMVLDFIDGGSFKDWLRKNRQPSQQQLETALYPLLGALEAIHGLGLLHRDIAPKNIMLAKPFRPVLIDFGAVRLLVAHHSHTVANMLTPGYAPCEQYSNRGQGPWTDIYALSATLYECVTGLPPPDGPARLLKDSCVPAVQAGAGRYDKTFLQAIDWGLMPLPQNRPQTIAQWMEALGPPEDDLEPVAGQSGKRGSWLGGWFGRS